MKKVRINIIVPADIGVTGKMVQDLLNNQLHFLLTDTAGGEIRWRDSIVNAAELPR